MVSTLLAQSYLDKEAQKLAIILYDHSPLKLTDLIKLTGDSPACPTRLLEGLKILICEHLIFTKRSPEDDDCLYYFDTDECLGWLYHPLFALYAKEQMGNMAWDIVSYFTLHKSLTLDRCLTGIRAEYEAEHISDSVVQREFNRLAQLGYLKYDIAGLKIPKTESASEHPAKSKAESLEQKLRARKEGKAKGKAQRKRKEKETKTKKAEEEEKAASVPTAPAEPGEDHFYRLDNEKFVYQLRTLQLVKVVEEKLGADASLLIKAMLDSSRLLGPAQVHPTTNTFTFEQLVDITKDAMSVPRPALQGMVDQLCKEEFRCLERSEITDEYYVNIRVIVNELLNTLVGRILESKYGVGPARVYRILRTKGQLEENQIVELSLMPQEEIRNIIETLYKDSVIRHTELAPRAGSVMRFYTVRDSDVKDMLVRLVHKAIANVLIKSSEEDPDDKEEELIRKRIVLKGCVAEAADQLMALSEF